jgi:hypothetical protein
VATNNPERRQSFGLFEGESSVAQASNSNVELTTYLEGLYSEVCQRIAQRDSSSKESYSVEVNLPFKRAEHSTGPGVTQTQFEKICDALTRRLAKSFPVLHDLVQVSGPFGNHKYTVCFAPVLASRRESVIERKRRVG